MMPFGIFTPFRKTRAFQRNGLLDNVIHFGWRFIGSTIWIRFAVCSDANRLETAMMHKALSDIAIREIRVVNPRTRNKHGFDAIVNSIAAVGLKKPITVTQRSPAEDGTRYDLVCGQGRMEACMALGYTTIPANVIEASKEDHFVMSLVENIARRPPSS